MVRKLALVALLLMLSVSVLAQVSAVPPLMNFQGRLAKPDGTPVADGTYSVRFSLHDALTGGTEKWTQTVGGVAVKNGSFSVLLSGFAAGTFHGNLYLEIKIGNDAPLAPRQQLVSVAYAMKASSVADGSIGTDQIADASITGVKIAQGSITPDLFSPSCSPWLVCGNIVAPGDFLGSLNNLALVLKANNFRAMQYAYGDNNIFQYRSINVLGGSSVNTINAGVVGATIAGGGQDFFTGTDYPNTITADFGTIGGGGGHLVSGFAGTVAGGAVNIATAQDAAVGGGRYNTANGQAATVAGGNGNTANGYYSTIAGGQYNSAITIMTTISGGNFNVVGGVLSAIAGGYNNNVSGTLSLAGGGSSNVVNGSYAAILGGDTNLASMDYAVVGGGFQNMATDQYVFVGGGYQNAASGAYAVVGGGLNNKASNLRAFVGGGWNNTASGDRTTIGGGFSNQAVMTLDTVGGGGENLANGGFCTVAGGHSSMATNGYSTVGGGDTNKATGRTTVVAGGQFNVASGQIAAISGGANNLASGITSTIPGGDSNIAAGDYSLAAGWQAQAQHQGAYVWADSQGVPFASTGVNQYLIRAAGGVGINTNSPAPYALKVNGTVAGVGAYVNASDARYKRNIAPFPDALAAILNLRGVTFNWKQQDFPDMNFTAGKQIGFIAQEVEKVLPELVTTDSNGYKSVAYANVVPILVEAVKTQNTKVERLSKENAELKARLEALEAAVQRLTAQPK